ncbi:putative phosphoenolpyruvate synthase isoform X1 [Asterias rubens]|uniref:putative phosphoenolpyruvate synthase isoform X1 n=2 Tax=Asterias rubens TaxID=7604 RepID=UPI0014558CDF|nr:putative phosphoenolpyruvate synthase isoform X1 [Asterias rubens]
MEFVTIMFCLVVLSLLAYIAVNLAVTDRGPLHGLYAVPGRWFTLKFLVMRCFVAWTSDRKHNIRKRALNFTMMQKKTKEVAKMESFYGFEMGQNCLYINGSDKGGATRLTVRVTIHPDDRREVWFLLRVPGVGDLVLPSHPDCIVDNVRPGDGFIGAGLTCTAIDPLKTWRISYNGLCRIGIRRNWNDDDRRPSVHVRCSLLWSAFTTFYDFASDFNPSLEADSLAKEQWTQEWFAKLKSMQQAHYTQFGMIHGVVQVDDGEESKVVMRGVKERLICPEQLRDFHTRIANYIVLENGNCLYVEASCSPGYKSDQRAGFLMKVVSDVIPASSVNLPLSVLMENSEEVPKNFTFDLHLEDGLRMDIKVTTDDTMHFNMGSDWCVQIGEGMARFTVNGIDGWGVCQTLRRNDGEKRNLVEESLPRLYREPDGVPLKDMSVLVVPLSARACQVSNLTGGKGSQLAKLVALRNQMPVEYEVPGGFCITTAAFDKHLKNNPDIQKAVTELSEVSCSIREGNLQEECERVVDLVSKTILSKDLKAEISGIFSMMFGDFDSAETFAVRSSAVGEDSSLTSSAGQMQTFLGVNSLAKVFQATQDCWASQFSFQAVQYRRQYGQPVDIAMAVVIQEMVSGESAGVAFSRDPLTGNPTKIVINSNYGLGESVVSGVVEADTVILRVDLNKSLTVESKVVGRKEEAICVAGGGGTQTIHQTDSKSASCSISDALSLKLGRVALLLDECFSDARDIEWAAVGDTIYLLQARAITTVDVPSQYELLHEFDSGLPSDKVWMSTANIQEMCPGAVSPLTTSAFFTDCDIIDQLSGRSFEKAISFPAVRQIVVSYNHAFISLTNILTTYLKMVRISGNTFGGMLFGAPFDEDCVEEAKKLTQPAVAGWRMYLYRLKFLLAVFFNRKRLEEEFSRANQHLTQIWNTAREQFEDICKYPEYGYKMLLYHALETHKSAVLQETTASLIRKYTTEELLSTHISMLLSSCPNVESAQVPLAMEKIAKAILKEEKSEEFQGMTPDDALDWLQGASGGEAGIVFADFLRCHGHRCIREVELRDKSWGMDPVQVIPSLQAILATGSHNSSERKRVLSAAEAVDQLGLALPSVIRKILVSYIVPKTRKGVACRESSKSMYIKINHNLKEAYWRLANLMVKEGRIPDEDLLFFFLPNEIDRLLTDRSPALISRALRRRRILPQQDSKRFQLVFAGLPQPIEEGVDHDITDVELKGTPISQGVVKGTARVVTKLQDAANIKKDDILVTRITDIGWTPYFPLISGLVTEIGGVLSHGAVVAREYGIPCVVNVEHATSVFKSGDAIVLNGALGTVEKKKDHQ